MKSETVKIGGGRARIEMDECEYQRMRDALGPDWEWRGLVTLTIGVGPASRVIDNREEWEKGPA